MGGILACHLVALDKNPSVNLIGIGEKVRHIIAKSVLSIIRPNVLEGAGLLELSAGKIADVEADIHTVHWCFNEESVEGVLLADAFNAFQFSEP